MLFLYRRTNPKTNEPKTFRPDFRRTVRISGPSDRRRRSGTNDHRLVEKCSGRGLPASRKRPDRLRPRRPGTGDPSKGRAPLRAGRRSRRRLPDRQRANASRPRIDADSRPGRQRLVLLLPAGRRLREPDLHPGLRHDRTARRRRPKLRRSGKRHPVEKKSDQDPADRARAGNVLRVGLGPDTPLQRPDLAGTEPRHADVRDRRGTRGHLSGRESDQADELLFGRRIARNVSDPYRIPLRAGTRRGRHGQYPPKTRGRSAADLSLGNDRRRHRLPQHVVRVARRNASERANGAGHALPDFRPALRRPGIHRRTVEATGASTTARHGRQTARSAVYPDDRGKHGLRPALRMVQGAASVGRLPLRRRAGLHRLFGKPHKLHIQSGRESPA